MATWKVKYVAIDKEGCRENKIIEVYGSNIFEAYNNADKVLVIIERGKTIDKLEVVTH